MPSLCFPSFSLRCSSSTKSCPTWLLPTIALLPPPPTPQEELEGVLRGSMRAATLGGVMRKMVRYLLSSTFTDTSVERNLLMDDVTPYLQV